MLATGTVINHKYEITGVIGHGGMSVVYRGFHRELGIPLAIKDVERSAAGSGGVQENSLVAEGWLLKSLQNDHLPRIYDVLEGPTRIMLVMDYIEGESLDKVLERSGCIAPELVIDWGIQICQFFHYLHTQNPPIIYRDMKPANVILQPNGNVMVIDFGTARTWKIDGSLDSDTTCLGTEGFAAPEQFGGYGQSDARTDIFCLGATLFNLVTGHSPFLPPYGIGPLGEWRKELKDSALDHIIQKCTARDPYERFQTASELQEALVLAKEGGKTGLLGIFKGKSGNIKKKEWQQSYMKVVQGNGASAQLAAAAALKNPAAAPQTYPPGSNTGVRSSGGGMENPASGVLYPDRKPPGTPPMGAGMESGVTPNLRPLNPDTGYWDPYMVEQQKKSQEKRRKTITMVALIVAVIAILITVVGVVLGSVPLAITFLVIALVALVLAVVGAVRYVNSE